MSRRAWRAVLEMTAYLATGALVSTLLGRAFGWAYSIRGAGIAIGIGFVVFTVTAYLADRRRARNRDR